MKGTFEHNIKTSLESYEAEFNSADWADMNSRLDGLAGKGKTISQAGKGLLIAASVIAAAGLLYYFGTGKNEKQPEDKTVVQVTAPAEKAAEASPVAAETHDQTTEANKQSAKNPVVESNQPVLNAVTENKQAAPEKTENQNTASNTVVENKTTAPVQPAVNENPAQSAGALNASFRADNNKICEGSAVQFTSENTAAPCTYKWYFGDGESSAEQNPKHIFKSAGTFTVRLKVTSDETKKSMEAKNPVTVMAAPAVDLTYRTDEENKLTIRFDAGTDKPADLKWDFGDKKTASGNDPEHTYSKFGTYKVVLTAKNPAGCAAVVSKEVKVENVIKLFAPNSFSPDGNGLNDSWIPKTEDECTFSLSIYDMRGSVVYTTNDATPWDGTNAKTGDKVKEGEKFSWVAIIRDKYGNTSKDKGDIIIMK